MSHTEQAPVVWSPSETMLRHSRMGEFIAWLEGQDYGPFADYHALHQWSIDDLETFGPRSGNTAAWSAISLPSAFWASVTCRVPSGFRG